MYALRWLLSNSSGIKKIVMLFSRKKKRKNSIVKGTIFYLLKKDVQKSSELGHKN